MILFKTTIVSAVMCLTLSAATALHAQDRMRAGNWENTVTTADGQTMTRNACLSAHDAAMSNGSPTVIRAQIEKALAKTVGVSSRISKWTVTARPRRWSAERIPSALRLRSMEGTASIRPPPRPGTASCQWPTSRAGGQETVRQANKQEERVNLGCLALARNLRYS
jgi:hypothetical protein